MNRTRWELRLYPSADVDITNPATWPLGLVLLAISSIVLLSVNIPSRPERRTDIPVLRELFPWHNAWQFFTLRHDFLQRGFQRKGNFFQFRVNEHKVIAMQGEAARRFFYGDRNLSFAEGYKIFMGGIPKLEDINIDASDVNDLGWFGRNLSSLLRPDRLVQLTPQLFADLERRIGMWPEEGSFDPFQNVYDLVFQLTARAATATEIADSPAAVSRISQLFFTIERGSNPRAMIFPWLPNRQVTEKEAALKELYAMLSEILERRRRHVGERKEDAVQVLMDEGISTAGIVGFVLSTLFAGVINTGINVCWTLLFLASHPEWKGRATTEVQSFLAQYAPESTESTSSASPLAARLSKIPPSAWENDTPVLDLLIRESIRIMSRGSQLRRNVREDVIVEGRTIPRGAFLAHPGASVHFDREVYTFPEEWDPSRFEKGREEDWKVSMGFVGWGAGRHPCLGKRFAQLEIKAILALFLLGIEYTHVDLSGHPTRVSASDVDRNNIFAARPKGAPSYIKYKKVDL